MCVWRFMIFIIVNSYLVCLIIYLFMCFQNVEHIYKKKQQEDLFEDGIKCSSSVTATKNVSF